MPGRRWSDGLHQAIEAKENVTRRGREPDAGDGHLPELFRMYKKLAGMTGTADTEAAEFHEIYKLDVVQIPTNKPMIRKDTADLVYKNEKGKFRAVLAEIVERHETRPAGARRHRLRREVRGAVAHAQARRASRTACSTPSTTSARPSRRAGRPLKARSPSRPTWPAAAPTSSWAATPSSWRAPRSAATRRPAIPGAVDENTPEYKEALAKFKPQCDAEKRGGPGRRRPAHPRHRAPRVAPHRQPAARPRRPPGRSGHRRASTCRSKTI